jgi:hypothetical protein
MTPVRAAILLVFLAGLCGCSRAQTVVTKAGDTVTVGDLVVSPNRRVVRGPAELHSLVIYPDKDVRFRFSRSLKGISLLLHEGTNRKRVVDRIAESSQPAPDLYAAPSTMSVLTNPKILGTAVIRVDRVNFFDKPLYVLCSTHATEVSWPRPRTLRNCRVYAQLSSNTFLDISFYDYAYPAPDWIELFGSLETGLKEMIRF